jgi:DNA-binding transcriptional MerR regulator
MAATSGKHQLPPEKKFFRIGEVAEFVGVKPYVLRYWETEFSWLSPEKSRMKQRVYSRNDVNLIQLIAGLLHGQRFTIEGARKVLVELKGDWASGLTSLESGAIGPGSPSASAAADDKQLRALQRKIDSLNRQLGKQDQDLNKQRKAQTQAAAALATAQQRLADLESENERLNEQLTKPQPEAIELCQALTTELEELLSFANEEAPTGAAVKAEL